MPRDLPSMNQVHLQQVETVITLAEELHFGRTARRLGFSQSRVSQLVNALESRIGALLFERTSRRVRLTATGAQFVAEIEPAYRTLTRTFTRARDRAMRGALRELRVGFTGMVYEEITATFRELRDRHDVAVHSQDLPFGSPFAAVLDGEVDAVIAELPVHEPALTVGFRFPAQDQFLALASDHPLARRDAVDVEQLAEVDLLHRVGNAPDYWMAARTPPATPGGEPISSTTGITTIQQGLALAASGRHAMLVCRPVTDHSSRGDLCFVPVRGLEESNQLALIWPVDRAGPPLRRLAALLDEAHREAVVV